MTQPSEQPDPVAALAEEFLARKRRGEHPTIDHYVAAHPDLAEQIRDLFPSLVLLENVGHNARLRLAQMPTQGPSLTHLGDYRILREIGRGGMGVVYEAEQQSLDRRVALKVLPPHALAGPEKVRRFHREARAAARLHHTNIVPVFGVGEEGGTHYYAMQFIHGHGLDGVLDELARLRREGPRSLVPPAPERSASDDTTLDLPHPSAATSRGKGLPNSSALSSVCDPDRSYWCSVARVGIQAADALAYAHDQGVIHRDIKPSNLILDVAGDVWVTDFGLARGAEDDALTHTGDILGTIRYMAPERFRGEADPRSDVYALGLTLYELLTLRPAFAMTDRLALIDWVKTCDPERPRSIDPRIPRDLETVVMKATEKGPERRYQTAGEMADDLRRFVADEPIKARRVSAAERLVRWARHKPVPASLVLALGVFLLLAAVGGVAMAVHFENLAGERETARLDAENLREDEQRANRLLVIERKRLGDERDATRRLLYQAQMSQAWSAWPRFLGPARAQELLAPWKPAPGGNGPDLRGWEWYYLDSLLHKEELKLSGHTGAVRAVAWAPDGKRLATGGEDGTVRVWDVATGQPRGVATRHDGPVNAASWHPGGPMLASVGDDGMVKVSDPIAGTILWCRPGTKRRLCAAWSPDGKFLATGGEAEHIQIWDANGTQIKVLPGHGSAAISVAWSPDGTRVIATADDEGVRVWNVADASVVQTFANPRVWNPVATWAGNGTTVAFTVENNRISLCRAAGGEQHRELVGHEGEIEVLAFRQDGARLASAGWDGVIRVWDTSTGHEVVALRGHTGGVTALAWASDGRRLASTSADGTTRVWAADQPQLTTVLSGHADRISSVSWAPDGRRLASSSWDRIVRIWHLDTGESWPLKGHTAGARQVSWSRDGKQLASGDWGGTLRIWDVATRSLVHVFTASGDLMGVEWAPDNERVVTAGGDGKVRVWDVPRRRQQIAMSRGDAGLNFATWGPDGKRIAAAGNDGMVRVWDVATGQECVSLAADSAGAYSVAWRPDGSSLATGGFGRVIRLWDTTSWSQTREMAGHTDAVFSLAWAPDGHRLASSSRDGSLTIWGPAEGREVVTFRTHTNQVPWVAWGPDGRRIATASHDHTVHVFDAGPVYSQDHPLR